MIRSGRQEGWLRLPTSSLRSWAELNGVEYNGISVRSVPGSGAGIVAARALSGGDEGPLVVVPRELVLSLEQVELQAKSDQHLKELLDALGEYARVGGQSSS